MAETDTNFDDIAARLGKRIGGDWARERVMRLMDGMSIPLDHVSDILFACDGAELAWTVRPRSLPQPAAAKDEEQESDAKELAA